MLNTIQTLEMALEALERYTWAEGIPWQQTEEAIDAIKAALAAPMQEPIECMCGICKLGQRPWVGLTDEEIQTIHDTYYRRMGPMEFAVMLEQRLKEKNT